MSFSRPDDLTPPHRPSVVDGVAFDVHGPQEGFPMFWLHGSPSCRWEAVLLRDWAHQRGMCVAAVDRPGCGASHHQPGWTMLYVARQLGRLANRLGWERFGVAGGSGGGPYVLAVAHEMPKRLAFAVSLACAGAFRDGPRVRPGLVDMGAAMAARFPGALRLGFSAFRIGSTQPLFAGWAEPLVRLGVGQEQMGQLFLEVAAEGARQGVDGWVRDTEVLHGPWGFDVGAIRCPVELVAGSKDGFVPLRYVRALADEIPGSRFEVAEGASHFETIFDHDRLSRLCRPR
ncbi:MAG: alpha/beta hydrolase [Myxococcota bacterium]